MSRREGWAAPRWARVTSALVPVVVVLYGITLIPGVRGPGPHFVGWLDIGVGDGTTVVAALLCLARAVLVPKARMAWALLGAGPLLYVGEDLVYYGFLAHDSAPPYLVIHRPAAAEQVTATLRAGLAPPEAASAL